MLRTSQKCLNILQHHRLEALICIVKYFWVWHLPNPHILSSPQAILLHQFFPELTEYMLIYSQIILQPIPMTSCHILNPLLPWENWCVICFSIITALEGVNDTQDSCKAQHGGYEHILATISTVCAWCGSRMQGVDMYLVRNEGENNDRHRWQFTIFHFHQLSHHFWGHTPCITLFVPVQNILFAIAEQALIF